MGRGKREEEELLQNMFDSVYPQSGLSYQIIRKNT